MDTSSPLRLLIITVMSAIVSTPPGCRALHIGRVKVPSHAELHGPAALACEYDAQGEPLYSVKWYKDQHEFYRYLADEKPNIRVFKQPGVNVDISRSNDTTLYLSDVDFQTAGTYMCEVSMDAPTFHTAVSSARISVVSLPPGGPRISGLDDTYLPGQTMLANCTIGPSYPRATLRWFLNEDEVDQQSLIAPRAPPAAHPHVAATWSALQLPMDAVIFKGKRRSLELRCQATIGDLPPKEATFTALLKDLPPPGNQRLAQNDATTRNGPTGALLFVGLLCSLLIRW